MDLNDIYESNSKWLKAVDLQGSSPVVQIESAEVMENTYNGETKKQVVLTFTGKEKKLGLNVTNATRIAGLLGSSDFTQWPGRSIRLYVDQTKLQSGQTVPCIRVFPDLPEQQAPAAEFSGPATKAKDEIPF